MSEAESINTMAQNSYKKLADGSYAVQTTASAGGSTQTVGIDPANNTVKLDQTDPNNRVATIPNPAANSTSLTDTNTVTAPAAGATICTVNLTVGTWDIECITYIGGTTVNTLEPTNMRLTVNAAAIGRIMNPVPGTTGGVGTGQLRARYVVASGTPAASIIAVSAATASSQYSGSIVARRVV
jgi:hypothetical protein